MYRYLLYFLMIFALPAQASKQALVIGNGDYAMSPLVNPVNDATDVASALERLGFEVMLVTNGDKFKMSQAVQQFSKKLKNQDAALFYFSGHGVSGKDQNQNDTNFLVGSFSEHLETGAALINESLNVNFVVRSLKDRNPDGVNIVILDACRNVPPKYLDQNKGTVDEHLVRLSSPQGFIIHYATQPLERAKGDKSSRNSLYTQSLLKALNNPQWVHNSAVDFFNNVGLLVTNNPENPSKQKPSLESSPVDFCFAGCGGVVQQAPVVAAPDAPAYVSPASKPARQAYEPEMVLIPAGTFSMGSNDGESDEKPVHAWKMGEFYMSKYEVTLDQFKAFVQETGYTAAKVNEYSCDGLMNPKRFMPADNHPVSCVHWKDAEAYTEWLSKKTGKAYRLPTEAEWEYAARAGSTTKWYFGNDESRLGEYAWYDANSGSQTHAVGQKKPNDFGLYDMAGNVWEWTCSEEGDYTDGKDVKCASGGDSRLLRGGSWLNITNLCRSAYRLNGSRRSNGGGFRVVFPVPRILHP